MRLRTDDDKRFSPWRDELMIWSVWSGRIKKTLLICFLLIPALAMSGCGLLSREYTYHKLSDSTVEITKYLGKAESLEIPSLLDGKTVTRIGIYAFSDCKSLKSVTLPHSVKDIGDCAFLFCNNLTSVTIPAGVTTIGNSAFSNCQMLTSVTIPVSVTIIGDSAFNNCSGLTSVSIPDSVTDIGKYAFSNCAAELTVTVTQDSCAEQYCRENGLKYKYPGAQDRL